MPNIKRPKVYKGSELPSTGKMSAIKTDLKRVPSKSVGSPKSSGIKTPSIKITSSGGGQFVRPASKKRSMGATQDPIKSVKTTANKKPINYNVKTGTSETPPQPSQHQPSQPLDKIPQNWREKKGTTKSKNNYGG